MVLAARHFEVYLGGRCSPIKVYTIHNPSDFLSQMSNSNQRVTRRSLLLQEYNLDIKHRKGSGNVDASLQKRSLVIGSRVTRVVFCSPMAAEIQWWGRCVRGRMYFCVCVYSALYSDVFCSLSNIMQVLRLTICIQLVYVRGNQTAYGRSRDIYYKAFLFCAMFLRKIAASL